MDYLKYHIDSSKIRDIDPANDMMVYLANRFELNMEQRYWLAFLYSTCYCGPTVYYIYNEFPDFENVDVKRLEKWWKANKDKCVFTTDRLRVKTSNQFVPTFESYKKFIGDRTQQQKFSEFRTPFEQQTWREAEKGVMQVRNVGRFTSFIYLEMVNVLTDFKCYPKSIDWDNADNCRQGLLYAYGYPTDKNYAHDYQLDKLLWSLQDKLKKGCRHTNIFNIETTLCAFKKHVHGKRHVGYYIERQEKEIVKMEENVKTGVSWKPLWDFRNETYKHLK